MSTNVWPTESTRRKLCRRCRDRLTRFRRPITRNSEQFTAAETRESFLFVSPAVLLMILLILVPVVGTLVTSLYRDVGYLPKQLSFPSNYLRLFTDIHFWQALQFTVLFVVISVSVELVLGLVFALLLNETLPGRGLLRVMLLLPWAIPNAVSARVWELAYNYEFGVLNFLLSSSGISQAGVNWLGSSTGAMVAVLIADIWKMTPFVTIILLAGLSSIPRDIYRQAAVDGATPYQRFYHITIRLLKPALVVALLFRTIDCIRVFDLLYVLTGGGPGGSTTSLSLYAYRFYLAGDFGYGSTVSVVVFLLAFVLGLAYIRLASFSEALR
ncbi:MAG: sugar ABC transporter permease [Candidatus Zixiibacteriota bacterium]|nr:MAG: sugar ABC transporter permease [candidate division Zixibacteria bacterium]